MTEVSAVFPIVLEARDLEFGYFEPAFVRHDLVLDECALCRVGLCTQQVLLPEILGDEVVIVHGRVPSEWGN